MSARMGTAARTAKGEQRLGPGSWRRGQGQPRSQPAPIPTGVFRQVSAMWYLRQDRRRERQVHRKPGQG